MFTTIVILLLAMTYSQVVPSQCANIYQLTSLPSSCNGTTLSCNFTQGISSLVVETTFKPYALCLILPGYAVTINGNIIDTFTSSLYLEATTIVYNITMIVDGNILLLASQSIIILDSNFTGQLVWIQASTVFLNNTQIVNESALESSCSCLNQELECTPWGLYFPELYGQSESFELSQFNLTYSNWSYNSIIILSNLTITLSNTSLRSSIIGLYSMIINLTESNVTTSGLGYPSDIGEGCGYFDEMLNQLLGCTGSGGSYGGFGGSSSPNNCNLMVSQPPYDNGIWPRSPGSGGGFFMKEISAFSSGGGIINIQCGIISLIGSKLEANGYAGIQSGGGGSGGAIALDYMAISGNGSISCNGGNARSSGGGGRLRLWCHGWKQSPINQNLIMIVVSCMGGLLCSGKYSCGENGSIVTSPCPPGYALNLTTLSCEMCDIGHYQVTFGYSRCLPCGNKPDNSVYKVAEDGQGYSYSQSCIYECLPAYRLKEYICLSSLEFVLDDIGGINALLCLGIIVVVLISYLIIMLAKKVSSHQHVLTMDNEENDMAKKRTYFRIEDVPYHGARIYLSGSNSLTRPWKIDNGTTEIFFNSMGEPFSRIKTLLTNLFHDINSVTMFSPTIKIANTILKIYYYPLSLFIDDLLRQNKAAQVQARVIEKSLMNMDSRIGIKFHTDSSLTIGCIELFDFQKESLDFYIKNYFPIYFKLHKLKLGGYCIDFTDPLLKALTAEIEQKDERKLFGQYLLQLNTLLGNSKQVLPILNHLWLISQQEASLQAFLWQPPGRLIGIDTVLHIDSKEDLFLLLSTEDVANNHFFCQVPMRTVYFDEIDCLKHKYSIRRESELDERQTVFWAIKNKFNEKTLSWSLGLISIVQLLGGLLLFFMVIFILVDNKVQFLSGVTLYFVIAPLCEFFMVFIAFNLVISKKRKTMPAAIYFTLSSLAKFLLMLLCDIIALMLEDFNGLNLKIVFVLCLVMLALSITSLVLLCLLAVHCSKVQ